MLSRLAGFGGGAEVAHNLLFNTCRESGDHGPINSWDRQPTLTRVRNGGGGGAPSFQPADTEVTRNFIIANYNSQEAIDNDDGSSGYHSHHNVLVYGQFNLKASFGGNHNVQNDNVQK